MRRRDFLGLPLLAFGPSSEARFQFTDVAAKAGLAAPVVYGHPDKKKYILETNGCGIAFFDYDHDGWLDIFVPGGSQIGRAHV